jgi:YidC/Oxa1 family membrane protein insertase
MERNLILAVILSAAVILIFQLYVQTVGPPPETEPKVTEDVKKTGERDAAGQEQDRAAGPDDLTGKEAPSSFPSSGELTRDRGVSLSSPESAPESVITIETPIYEAVVSSRGARLISFKLKDYYKSRNRLDPVNLFDRRGPDSSGPSLMFTADKTFEDSKLNFKPDTQARRVSLSEGSASKTITFTARTDNDLVIEKSYTFHKDKYLVDFNFTITNTTDESRSFLISIPWKKVYTGENADERFAWNSAEIYVNEEVRDYYFRDIEGDEEPAGSIKWAGLGEVYFFKAIVLDSRSEARISLFKTGKEGVAEFWARLGNIDLPAGKPVTIKTPLYLGPKKTKALEDAGYELSRALYYSKYQILDVTAEYLIRFLRYCTQWTGNYGFSIIVLTIIIKILFIPLTHKSMKSMKRMQELQPQLTKLKEKYKDDREQLNRATMELFKEHKVNPIGGCWPILLQLPVFIALYQALSYAIELRHASFVCIPSIYLCINDLSAPDPYYVTPVLMGASMALQQWLTPSAGDPMQRKMMMVMPLVLTYLFLSFPAGLVLYWLINNILSIGQQLVTNKMAA